MHSTHASSLASRDAGQPPLSRCSWATCSHASHTGRWCSGSRCLLVGANGAGKSSLLQLLAGKFMVQPDTIRVLGRPAFHDLALSATGTLGYLGPQWRRDIACAGSNVPMQACNALLQAMRMSRPGLAC